MLGKASVCLARRAKHIFGQRKHSETVQRRKYSAVSSQGKRNTLFDLKKKYSEKKPLVLVTSYSASETALIEKSGAIDAILVGDSAGMVVAGHRDTTPVTMDEMVYHCKAATSSAKKLFVIGDMPFGSYEVSDEDAARNAIRLVKEGRVDAVKLEGGRRMAKRVEAIVGAGVPVMGHIGLTPQSQSALGGFRVQGKTAEDAVKLIEDAKALEKAGCFAIVVEGVPEPVADAITKAISVPTIGIGAGAKTNGQILVFHDMFGMFSEFQPKFTKRFRDAGAQIVEGLKQYASEVSVQAFPATEHTYSMKAEEVAKMQNLIQKASAPQQQQPTGVTIQVKKRKKHVAVIGGGAMGSLFSSRLSLAHPDAHVWLISSWKDHVEKINSSSGLEIQCGATGDSRHTTTLRATHDPREVVRALGRPVDFALVMVKSGQTAEAAEKAAQALDLTVRASSVAGYALTLQNGLGNREILAARLGPQRVLQGVTSQAAMIVAPGVVRHTGNGFTSLAYPQSLSIEDESNGGLVGIELMQAMRFATEDAARLFTEAGIKTDCASVGMESLVWGKLVVNSVINPLTAIMGVRNGEILNSPEALYIVHKVVEEASQVARARGIELPSNPAEMVVQVLKNTAENRSSMLQDVLRGTTTEIDAINGAIVREGEKLGIDVTVNKAMLDVMVQKNLVPKKENLDLLLHLMGQKSVAAVSAAN